MSVSLLIVTHNELGSVLLETATKMLGRCPMLCETLAVTESGDTDLLQDQAQHMYDDLDQGDGVLVLTDIFGSTPANIACRLRQAGGHVCVVAGVNLPMLVRILNYAQLDLDALAEKAESGGRDGVLPCKFKS
jgi:PTS system mannose-specific IIA component